MSKIQLNKNQKEVLFIVALFLVPFLDPGFGPFTRSNFIADYRSPVLGN